jgi:mRNA interferase RelE/StbE
VVARINALEDDPRPDGVVTLTGSEPPLYRVREGDWRIVYRIKDEQLRIIVIRIGHRSEVYGR